MPIAARFIEFQQSAAVKVQVLFACVLVIITFGAVALCSRMLRWMNGDVLCGWLLHCKSFLAISAVIFVSTVVCPACLCGGVPLALMNSASEVPIGLSTLEEGRRHSRSILALG